MLNVNFPKIYKLNVTKWKSHFSWSLKASLNIDMEAQKNQSIQDNLHDKELDALWKSTCYFKVIAVKTCYTVTEIGSQKHAPKHGNMRWDGGLPLNGKNGITIHLCEINKINWVSMPLYTQKSIAGDIKTHVRKQRIYNSWTWGLF